MINLTDIIEESKQYIDNWTDYKKFFRTHGVHFRAKDWKISAKKEGNNRHEYLMACLEKYGIKPGNFQPPAKCLVIAKSRDFSEWPIVQVSKQIQDVVYNCTKEEIEEFSKLMSKKNNNSRAEFYSKKNIKPLFELLVQNQNSIIGHAIARYQGVVKKHNNRIEKLKKNNSNYKENLDDCIFDTNNKLKKRAVVYANGEPKLDENGKPLIIDPIGFNPNIYCAQGNRMSLLTVNNAPIGYEKYVKNLDEIIPIITHVDRINIPFGQPGYIPEFQRNNLNKNRRFRNRNKDLSQAIMGIVYFGDDWLIFDARGLLRNARWRKLADKNITYNELMNLFTGDPVIDTKRNIVTFLYDTGVVNVNKQNIHHGKKTKEVLENAGEHALLGIDFGVTNIVSAGLFKSNMEKIDSWIHDDMQFNDGYKAVSFRSEFNNLKRSHDDLEKEILDLSLEQIPSQIKNEYTSVNNYTSEDIKDIVCNSLQLSKSDLNWDKMNENSTFISEKLIENGVTENVKFKTKTGKEVNRKDISYFKFYKPKLSLESRKVINDSLFKTKIKSPGYDKLSMRKKELSRRFVNSVINMAKKKSNENKICICIEDFTVDNRFASGHGKARKGWSEFGNNKKENRWMIQSVYKAFTELAEHKGHTILEVNSFCTSQRCPKCHTVNSNNRDKKNREKFKCISCGHAAHSDRDVATYNIAHVAYTGKRIERPRDDKNPRGARKSKKSNEIDKMAAE